MATKMAVPDDLLKNAGLILLSFLFLPITTSISVCASLVGRAFKRNAIRPGTLRRNVLVTGVGMSKGLVLARAFHLAGHYVVGADFEPSGALSMGRASKAISRFYRLRSVTSRDSSTVYVQDLMKIIVTEKIDLWVSCSGVASAVEDGEAKEIIEKRTACKAIQFDIETTQMLHEKHTFIEHAGKCGLIIPDTHTITSAEDAARILRNAPPDRQYIMKTIGVVDAARADMTLLPKATNEETSKHLQRLVITKDCPWILQQYIKGEEFCTHAVVIRGQVKVFVACPSAELLMHYKMLPATSPLSMAMLAFTQRMAKIGGASFTGHLSFDFMVEKQELMSSQPRLYPIECNPRAHTAVVLFAGTQTMVDSYMSLLDGDTASSLVTPAQMGGYKYYWIGHDLFTKILLPTMALVSLQASLRETMLHYLTFVSHLLFWYDGTFALWDPWPWWWLYHVYWPLRLFSYMRSGRKWSRINVSTTKVFEC
jgi:catechol O-methyltransferase